METTSAIIDGDVELVEKIVYSKYKIHSSDTE
jgi:hypothetical protein